MPFARTLLALPALLALAAATTVADDLMQLQNSCQALANILNASLNNTSPMNTSSMVQSITWEVGASIANLPTYYNQSSSTTPAPSPANTSSNYDGPYFAYADSILDLTEALIQRGQAPHGEANLPVYNALQGLYNVVQTYGFQLDDAGKISRSAMIRTLTAGNSIVDAESVWARNVSTLQKQRRAMKRGTYLP